MNDKMLETLENILQTESVKLSYQRRVSDKEKNLHEIIKAMSADELRQHKEVVEKLIESKTAKTNESSQSPNQRMNSLLDGMI